MSAQDRPKDADNARAPTADASSRVLAGFVHGLKLEELPESVRTRALHLMLDTIGCGLAARREDFGERYAAAVFGLSEPAREGAGRGVIGFSRRLPARDAMLLNGVLTHGLDYDDTHMAGVIHLSVSLVPALLATAAERGATGAQLLGAYIAGLEAGARIASVAKGGLHAQGFHPTGVIGTFACALAVGRLIGLGPEQLLDAQGISLSLAGGSLQFLEDGAWTKRLHPGWAAQAGWHAAMLAAGGIPAPHAPYEGRYGLFHNFLGTHEAKADIALATAGIDESGRARQWELLNIAIKPFPMCHFVHAVADAAIALRAQGLRPEDVERVEVRLPETTLPVVGSPIEAKRRPRSDYDAKFSAPYAVASGLARGRLGLAELMPDALVEPAVLRLMDRIDCVADLETTFPAHYTGELRVRLRDGSERCHREPINRGHAERPLTNEDVRRKFEANGGLHFGEAHVQAIARAVQALESATSVLALEALLATEPLSRT